MVAAFHLDDFVAAGEATGYADGMHGHLGSTAAETHLLDWKALANFIGEQCRCPLRIAECAAAMPELRAAGPEHRARCILVAESNEKNAK